MSRDRTGVPHLGSDNSADLTGGHICTPLGCSRISGSAPETHPTLLFRVNYSCRCATTRFAGVGAGVGSRGDHAAS